MQRHTRKNHIEVVCTAADTQADHIVLDPLASHCTLDSFLLLTGQQTWQADVVK